MIFPAADGGLNGLCGSPIAVEEKVLQGLEVADFVWYVAVETVACQIERFDVLEQADRRGYLARAFFRHKFAYIPQRDGADHAAFLLAGEEGGTINFNYFAVDTWPQTEGCC